MDKLLYTRKETAAMLSISTDKLDDLRKDGLLQGYNIGKDGFRIYFKAPDVHKLVERLEVASC